MRTRLRDLVGMTVSAIQKETSRGVIKAFTYTSAPTAVAASTNGVQTLVNIDGSSHFFLCFITGTYILNATKLATFPSLHAEPQLQITDQASGQNLFDRPLRWYTIVGNGQQAFPIDPPYIFEARSAMQVTFDNVETVAYEIELSFIGFKVFLE